MFNLNINFMKKQLVIFILLGIYCNSFVSKSTETKS